MGKKRLTKEESCNKIYYRGVGYYLIEVAVFE